MAEPTWKSATFPLSLAGTNELFLNVSASNAMFINWVQFEGEGVTVIKAPPVDGNVGRQRPGDPVAVARHAGRVRRVHAGRRQDVLGEHGQPP